MLKLTSLGHATLSICSKEAKILCDPILGDSISVGNIIFPGRTLFLENLYPLDAVLISHHHSDHFSLSDLEMISGIRSQRILAPKESTVIDELQKFGCSNVEGIEVGQSVSIRDITLTATPSAVDFPEVGFLFQSDGASVLNLVDSQIHGVIDQFKDILDSPPGLLLAPFQSGGYMSFLPLRVGSPPTGLVDAIEEWAKQYTEELVEDLLLLDPQYIVPFADGLIYKEKEINSWHFPLSDEFFCKR